MDKFWKNRPNKPSDDGQKTQIVPRFAQEDATQIVKPPVQEDATQIVKPPVSNAGAEEIPEGIMMDEEIPEGSIMDDVTQFVPPPPAPVTDDVTQIVKRPVVDDITQIIKPPVMDEKTHIVKPPITNNPFSNPNVLPPFPSVPSPPPMLSSQHYETPNHNMTQLVKEQKPVEVLPPPPIESRGQMGEHKASIPAFAKWIGGLALLVLLFNMGQCLIK